MSFLTDIKENRGNTEFQQVLARFGFFIIGIIYIGMGSYSNYYPISRDIFYNFGIAFFTYSVISFWHVIKYPDVRKRPFVTLFLDVLAITYGVYLTGGAASPLYVMYIWVYVSQAVRFGRANLYVSVALSVSGYILVITLEQSWSQKTFEATFLVLSLLVLPVYIDLMLKRLKKARQAADEANKAKSIFLMNMSHELRTPLNAIIGYSELLSDDADTLGLSDCKGDLHKIYSSGQHLLSLISNILDLSKIEAGKIALEFYRIDVRVLVSEIESTVRGLIEKSGNTCKVEYINDPGTIYTDETRLKQILINLLGNAAKFTLNGKVSLVIERMENMSPETIKFVVTDDGIGIRDEQVDFLFAPFTQADSSITKKYGGTGLGLYISQSYCRMMGGNLVFNKRADKGSCFTVELPVNERQPVINNQTG
ncbi:MAG TPA: hypothetical protein ENI65_12090 [Gammaproteobacteria bacterium]|nr:hypothetical protein [Gammaproteobacteria bacterium]